MKILLLIVLLTMSGIINGQDWSWARSGGGTGNDCNFSAEIQTDANGNSYIAGYFEGVATIGSFTLTSAGLEDILIAKFDGAGNCLWAVRAGGVESDFGRDVSIDSNGNCYVTGTFRSTSQFGSNSLSSYGGHDIFTARYDGNNGNCIWVSHGGGTGSSTQELGYGIISDNTGNSYITGVCEGLAIFGSVNTTSSGFFIAKYDVNGNCNWVTQTPSGSLSNIGVSLALNTSVDLYVAGYFSSSIFIIGTDTLDLVGDQDAFLARLDTAGNFLWGSTVAGGFNGDFARDVSTDGDGNIYITGGFEGNTMFGDGTINLTSSPVSSGNAYVAKYTPAGNIIWATNVTGSPGGSSLGHGIIYSSNSNSFYLSGLIIGTGTFGTHTLTSAGSNDIFTAKYDTSGICNWARKAGGASQSASFSIGIDNSDNLYVTGYYQGICIFGNDTLNSAGVSDFFIAKLDTSLTTGISDLTYISDKHIVVFPNPSHGNVTIQFSENIEKAVIEVNDVYGMRISSETFYDRPATEIFLNNIASGIYFVKISYGNKSYCRKIIIEKD